MVRNEIINEYLSFGKNLIPLDNKIPRTGWRNTIYSKNELFTHEGNIGWKLSDKDIIIDIDPRNNGLESFKKLQKETNLKLDYTVKTPRGGWHIYLKIPEKYAGHYFKKTLKGYEGIDFLTEGSYCLICGCETINGKYSWNDDILGGFNQEDCPDEILNLITFENKLGSNSNSSLDLGDFQELIGGASSSWPENKVVSMLNKLDPSMPHDDWVRVGMALHDWDPSKGLELWEKWSIEGKNYDEGETEKRWGSFKTDHGVTLRTINYMVKEVSYDETQEKINTLIEKIKFSNEKQIEFEIVQEIKKSEFNKLALEKIAKAIQDRLKELTKTKMPIGEIRNLISSNTIVTGEFVGEHEVPDWVRKWVYINSHNSFANLENLKFLKSEAFNIENGKHIPENLNGNKQSAVKYLSDKGFIKIVDMVAYLPNINEPIVTIDDFEVLNSFNKKTVPKATSNFTKEGLKAIELIKKHIDFICGSREKSHILTQWIAHQIQFPGKQILWSPVIQAIQGVGKSFFGELLRCCLGDRNVGTVSPSQVVSDFNGWATGVSVNVLEELRVKGHNRYDAVNSLKPLITDRMIQINDKGIKQFITYNTTNYICFTNYKDAIPLDSDDRRWWVIFVPVESLKEMEEKVNEKITTYFPRLFDAVRVYGCEVRKWLLEYEITSDFLKTKQAPMTDDKMSMIATEESSVEGYFEVREMIEKGGKYYNKEVVSSFDLFNDLLFENPNLQINNVQKNMILKKLGYNAQRNPIKINGKLRRVWTKKNYGNDKIRELISNS